MRVLITGADGYVGRLLLQAIQRTPGDIARVVATDMRRPEAARRLEGVTYEVADVRNPKLADLLRDHEIDVVVHLAAIVTPGKRSNRELEYSVDVLGTKNVLECCLRAGVKRFVTTSSGAAYGYYADNPEWLDEEDEIRGNVAFAYSDHKRQVEEMLARWREEHPELQQLIFRPGTILGATTSNQITALFEKRVVIGLRGADSPFVIIWDQDVVAALLKGIREQRSGIYNLAGDGVLTLKEMAKMMGKPYVAIPVPLVTKALAALKRFGLSQYGPEQVDFLRYRPVLSNRRLKEELGYVPQKTTGEVFEYYLEHRGRKS
jgi:UDP-glucose 4-epimerase